MECRVSRLPLKQVAESCGGRPAFVVLRHQVDSFSAPLGPRVNESKCKSSHRRVDYVGQRLHRGQSHAILFNFYQSQNRLDIQGKAPPGKNAQVR